MHELRQMEIVIFKNEEPCNFHKAIAGGIGKSSFSGERLAAIALLKNSYDYLNGGRKFKVEKPLLVYHAAIALLTAVRTLGKMQV